MSLPRGGDDGADELLQDDKGCKSTCILAAIDGLRLA